MPEMTPERIASLAQSAKERDPNPEPLDAPGPERAPVPMRASILLSGGREVFIEGYDLQFDSGTISKWGGVLALHSSSSRADGDWCAMFAAREWQSCVLEEIGDDDSPDAVEDSGRVLTDADVSRILESPAAGNAPTPESIKRAEEQVESVTEFYRVASDGLRRAEVNLAALRAKKVLR